MSPKGERVSVRLSGRGRCGDRLCDRAHWPSQKIEDRRFRRLLSAGYKVVEQNDDVTGKVGEEEKKNTDLVIGTTKSGDASHGGDHASCEVEDSPNHAERGNRGRRGKNSHHYGRKPQLQKAVPDEIERHGGFGVYSPTPLRVEPGLLESAEESAKLLAELIGKSQKKIRRGTTIDVEELLIALEMGDNPLPPLEAPDERPKMKILVTPDCSGSTQGWSGLGQAWALHLSKLEGVDVIYAPNFNGEFYGINQSDVNGLISSVDILIYLGDGDGYELCRHYSSMGATVIALDSYSANVAKPRLTELSEGGMYWVDRVSAKAPKSWAEAVEICLKKGGIM